MQRRLRLLVSLFALVFLAAAFHASLAAAAPGWVAPESISEPAQTYSVRTAVDDRGNAIAVWAGGGIQLATHAPGGEWTTPTEISSDDFSSEVVLAMNPAGEAVIAWIGYDPEPILHIVTRSAAGSLTAELDLSAPGEFPSRPSITINDSGAAVVAWLDSGSGAPIRVATRPPGGDFSAPAGIVSAGIETREATVAINGTGAITLAWAEERPGTVVLERSTRAAGASSFSSPEVVFEEAGGAVAFPSIATNAAGDTLIAWQDAGFSDVTINATARAAGDTFSAPVQISSAVNERQPRAVMDASGEATIVWTSFDTSVSVQAAGWNPVDGFSPSFNLSGPEGGALPSIAANADGETLVAWLSEDGKTIKGSWKAPGGAFSAPAALGLPGYVSPPSVAIGADGNGFAAWPFIGPNAGPAIAGHPATSAIGGGGRGGGPVTRAPSPDSVVAVAGFDATPPALTALGVPPSGTVGEPVSFSSAATDAWDRGPLSTFEFGDGDQASGDPVSHTYDKPGTYTVKAFATNSVGSASPTATRSITIGPVPGTPASAGLVPVGRVGVALRGSRKLPIAGGAVKLKIENTGTSPVGGTLNLWTTAHLKVPLPASVGKQDYRLAVGETATVRVELSQEALELIKGKRIHRLAVQVDASFRDAGDRGGMIERHVKLRG
jgi:hypothetical protein